MDEIQKEKVRLQIPEVLEQLQAAKDDGFRIIYLDEMMVTMSTIPTHEYSTKNISVDIDRKQYSNKAISVLAGISAEHGVELVMTWPSAVNIPKFKVYLEQLRRKYFHADLCIYMDNLSVHTSNEMKERYDEISLRYIFNPILSPDFNPIEMVFSQIKGIIKRKRLEAIMQNINLNIEEEIHQSFEQINKTSITNCIQHSFKLLNNN